MVVDGHGSGDWPAGGAVVPDRGGQSERALSDPGADPVDGAATMQFEVELAFESVETDSIS